MNVYLIVILGSMYAMLALDVAATLLNLGRLGPELPAAARGWYEPEAYARSQRYTRAAARLDMASSIAGTLALTAAILLGGFQWADQLARIPGLGPIGTGLVYYAILLLVAELFGLPVALYRTFGLEARFGFNRTTARTFVADKLKGLALTAVIGGPLAAMVLWFFQAAGPLAWLWAWAGTTAVTLALHYLAPSLILPLFNTFTPLPDGPLRDAIQHYADANRFEISGISTIDGSRRSAKANAFFTGLGKRKRIALFDTLIEQQTPEEITAVLAHEVGHHKCGHIPRMLAISVAKLGLVFLLMSLTVDNHGLAAAFQMTHASTYSGLVFFLLLYNPLAAAFGIATQSLSRKHEFQADAFAAQTTANPAALASALRKLSTANLSNLTPHPLYVTLNYSHPPVLERVERLLGQRG